MAELVLAAATSLGILISLWVSIHALQEVRKDRHQRQCPHLAFDAGGYQVPVAFVRAGTAIPGVERNAAALAMRELPPEAESVRMQTTGPDGRPQPVFLGRLRNYGLGPALETRVLWRAEEVTIGSERFQLTGDKLSEARYAPALNTMPAWHEHIAAGEESGLTRLPTFVEKDIDKKVVEVRGVLEIGCRDVFGNTHHVSQEFYIHTGYGSSTPHVQVTFGRLRRGEGDLPFCGS